MIDLKNVGKVLLESIGKYMILKSKKKLIRIEKSQRNYDNEFILLFYLKNLILLNIKNEEIGISKLHKYPKIINSYYILKKYKFLKKISFYIK